MIARTLELSMDELGPTALQSTEDLEITSMCSVFAESEVISLIANNKEKPDIANGICRAIANKAYSLLKRVGLEAEFMMTGAWLRIREWCVPWRKGYRISCISVMSRRSWALRERRCTRWADVAPLQRQTDQPICLIGHKQRNIQHIIIQLQIVQRKPYAKFDPDSGTVL